MYSLQLGREPLQLFHPRHCRVVFALGHHQRRRRLGVAAALLLGHVECLVAIGQVLVPTGDAGTHRPLQPTARTEAGADAAPHVADDPGLEDVVEDGLEGVAVALQLEITLPHGQ